MARLDIRGSDLARELEMRQASLSSWRNNKTIPAIGGEKLDNLVKALSKLSGMKVRFTDLFEEIDN
jgi:cell division FtsZ-interacting protein ZapD